MSYTIETIIKVDGGAYPFFTKCEGSPTDKDFAEFLARHTESVESYLKPKHPLEEIFAAVRGTFDGVNLEAYPSTQTVDEAFTISVGLLSPCGIPHERVKRLTTAIRLSSVRLLKMGFYKTLPEVLQAAVEQATKGKGQRHGGDKTPFLEQPWVRLYKTHGLGFLLGQADKKYNEALGKGNQEDQVREILGAIVYLGMALLVLEGKVK